MQLKQPVPNTFPISFRGICTIAIFNKIFTFTAVDMINYICDVFRIQACWKAYVVRKRYRELRKDCVPNEPILRKKFYEQKVCIICTPIQQ